MNQIQRAFERIWEFERQKHGGSYLVALYNLHLPTGQLSLEDKKRLSNVVRLFFESPPVALDELPSGRDARPSGFSFFKTGFAIHKEMMRYLEFDDKTGIYLPGESWWLSEDFIAFQRNYQHLRGCLASCIEGEGFGNFHLADLEWLNEKVQLIRYTVCLSLKNPIPLVVGNTPGTARPVDPTSLASDDSVIGYIPGPANPKHLTSQARSPLTSLRGVVGFNKEHPEHQIPLEHYRPIITLAPEHDIPPSDLILYQAYLEIMGIINNQEKFGRCQAEATPRRLAGCQNVFPQEKRRGPKRRWCSDTCRRRVHEAKKRGKEKDG